MWSGTRYCRGLLRYGSLSKFCKNRFMSDEFKCEAAWNKRLKSSLLQKVNLDDLFNDMETKYNLSKSISAVDVDIFVNSVNDSHFDEMEEIVHRLRLSQEATNIFPSTHHAFIRAHLAHGDPEELMRILNDRLNYGIFPDDFCSILLIDYFIEKEDFRNAAKVATMQMLQEDFYNDLFKYLSLYSCSKFLLNPSQWEDKIEENPEDSSGEEVKVRVKYLRNPYFDNHFDLKEPNALIGKTFDMICQDLDETVRNDVKFISCSLLKKWNITKNLIDSVKDTKLSITGTTVDIVERIITNETNEEETKNEAFQSVKNGIAMLKSEKLASNSNLLDVLEKNIKENIMIGDSIAQRQIKLYEEWENLRENALRDEIEELNRTNMLELIKKKKQELLEKEQEIFFFEREDEIDITIENKKVHYPAKWLGKKKKKRSVDIEYVPPEIIKQRTSS